ncbi:hypothetical protein C8F01DRAFT_1243754 [Mycena amicta]|nr:hypothetical protein C8F01DRAFT_1243754 [Mycena amicta]
MAGILTLPSELISEIFIYTLSAEYPLCPPLAGPQSPTELLAISHRLRTIALSTPHLWRAVDITLDAAWHSEAVHAWLRRSAATPLSIRLNCYHDEDPTILSPVLAAIINHRARWEYLFLAIHTANVPLLSGPAPLLREVEIVVWEPRSSVQAVEALQVAANLVFSDARRLLAVRFSDVFGAVECNTQSLPWTQLTSLTLEDRSCKQILPILKLGTSLVYCMLTLSSRELPPPPPVVVRLPRLEKFILSTGSRGGDGNNPNFLAYLDLPGLRRFQLAGSFLSSEPIACLMEFIARSGCVLDRLFVSAVYVQNAQVEQLRAVVPGQVTVESHLWQDEDVL